MNIKEAIISIEKKYGLEVSKPYEIMIKNKIVEILNQIPHDKIVAVRGAGEHTSELLSIEGCNVHFKYIFDYSKQEKEIVKIAGKKREVYPCNLIMAMNIDIIIISSYTHRKKIREELEKLNGNFMILDLYDELQKSGLDVNAPFYRNTEDMYENVIYHRKKYFLENSAVNLKNLIIAYLKIYDFINFYRFAEEYICNKYQDYQDIQNALDEVKQLLNFVKIKIRKRQQRDIVTIWNDQLDYSWLEYAPYMKKKGGSSMFFENAYTMTPFTVPTILEMFQGLKSIDDEIYHNKFCPIDSINSNIIKELELCGYVFIYIGDDADARLFEKKYTVSHYPYSSSCIRCVDMLQILLDTEQPVCILLHALVETHNPYLSGELHDAKYYEWPTFTGGTEEKALEQRKKSVLYWDKQIEFYMGFLSDNCIKIFMSDHGPRYNIQPIYKEPTTHIIFFINGKDIPKGRYKKLFSIYDFYKIIQCILKSKFEEDYIFSSYVLMQETNIFNSTAICYYLKNNAEECFCSFRAVRTEKELYVKLSSGKKYYYLLPDEETNYIAEADKERLAWLDKLAGDKFEDLSKHEKEIEDFRKQFEAHE